MRYLLDTDTLVYWLKGNQSIETKALTAGLDTIAISIISKAELYYGVYRSTHIDSNLAALKKLTQNLTVLPFNEPAALQFGEIKAELKETGNLIMDADMMIAAIALTNNLLLITNNTKHFQRIKNLKLTSWLVAER